MITHHIPPGQIFEGTDRCSWELHLGEQYPFELGFGGYSTLFHETHPTLSGLVAPYRKQVTF